MLEPDKKKKKKQKVKYNVLFVPDVATADVKRFSMSMWLVMTICVGIVLLISAAFIYCYYLTNHILVANTSINSLRNEMETLNVEKQTLTSQNEELLEKVTMLSEALNERNKQEEERLAMEEKKYVPTGFPVKGHSSYDEELTSHDNNPAAVFNVDVGASVVATAIGNVSSIEGDNAVGYIIMVDHGNGYVSVYRNESEPKVIVGDEVTNSTDLFTITDGHEKLVYQVISNGTYVDPLGLMEIYG